MFFIKYFHYFLGKYSYKFYNTIFIIFIPYTNGIKVIFISRINNELYILINLHKKMKYK